MMKRVNALLRVSTKGQVDKLKDDIPMQRVACHEFAEQKGWVITNEFVEKGVSGFKISANDRDAIQDLKEAAIKKEFDVLLVFMFDRIGRIDDETPFVVEWFVKHGIEVYAKTACGYKYPSKRKHQDGICRANTSILDENPKIAFPGKGASDKCPPVKFCLANGIMIWQADNDTHAECEIKFQTAFRPLGGRCNSGVTMPRSGKRCRPALWGVVSNDNAFHILNKPSSGLFCFMRKCMQIGRCLYRRAYQ